MKLFSRSTFIQETRVYSLVNEIKYRCSFRIFCFWYTIPISRLTLSKVTLQQSGEFLSRLFRTPYITVVYLHLSTRIEWSIELPHRTFEQAAPNAHVGAASFGFIRASEILSRERERDMKKKVHDLRHRTERSRRKRAMYHGCVAQFSRSFVDDRRGKMDIVARPAGSWNPIRRFLGRGCLPTRGSMS